MPELPDVEIYVEHIAARTAGHVLERVRLASPFVLRTATPPLSALHGHRVREVRRIGKRIAFAFDTAPVLHLVIHLMVAGRFKWKPLGAPVPGKLGLAAFDFAPLADDAKKTAKKKPKESPHDEGGTLILTEASTKKRASIHVVDDAGLDALNPGGLEVLAKTTTAKKFGLQLRSENHTLKRALTDPHLFSGIGNSYSDEILHHAQMSPVRLTQRLTDEEVERLFEATKHVLVYWTDLLRKESGDFPEKVTAFRPEMAVHGKYGKPCPRCGKPVQRIRYADNESNYCPTCQTEGKLLADRSLSRLMRGEWPKTLEELEAKKAQSREAIAPSADPGATEQVGAKPAAKPTKPAEPAKPPPKKGSFAARAASFIPSRPKPE